MHREILEADWKLFRRLQPLALERFCRCVLDDIARLLLSADSKRNSHERYLAVCKLIRQRDEELADSFDNPRRSTAFVQLARIRAEGLLTEEEFAGFSSETRAAVQVFLDG